MFNSLIATAILAAQVRVYGVYLEEDGTLGGTGRIYRTC